MWENRFVQGWSYATLSFKHCHAIPWIQQFHRKYMEFGWIRQCQCRTLADCPPSRWELLLLPKSRPAHEWSRGDDRFGLGMLMTEWCETDRGETVTAHQSNRLQNNIKAMRILNCILLHVWIISSIMQTFASKYLPILYLLPAYFYAPTLFLLLKSLELSIKKKKPQTN